MDGDDVCRSSADVERLDGRPATVVGTYEEVDVRARQTSPPVYEGHAAVRLPDGMAVLIEPSWSAHAIRDDDERARAVGQVVRVRGVLHASCPEPPEPDAAIVGPCLTDVASVEVD
jgi:hypothetical protein